MTDEKIQIAILRYLYDAPAKLSGKGPRGNWIGLDTWAQDVNLEAGQVWNALDRLCQSSWVERSFADRSEVALTPAGIHHVEDNQITAIELVCRNQGARQAILNYLARRHEEGRPGSRYAYDRELQGDAISDADFQRAIAVLVHDGLVMEGHDITWHYQLTDEGLLYVRSAQVREACRAALAALDAPSLTLQQRRQRGHAFERLLADICVSEGWEVITNGGGPGEEHDLVIFQNNSAYIVECKWHADPVETETLRGFAAKIQERDTPGIFISMSGFTQGAKNDTAYRFITQRILLFGRTDVDAVFAGHVLADLLHEKNREAVVHRQVLLDGQLIPR